LKRLNRLLLIVLFGLLLFSCENEIDVTADWKEIPVIYGLIDPAAEYNYIRVNRAYLNESGDALSYAGISDSIQFDELSVKVVEYEFGVEKNTIIFERVSGDSLGLAKDSGIFSYSPNILFRSNYQFKRSDFQSDLRYDLYVVNETNGKTYKSSTPSPGALESLSPVKSNRRSVNISDKDNSNMSISYREGIYVKSYDLVIRFRYEEYDKSNPTVRTVDSLDWKVFKGKETKNLLRGYSENYVIVPGVVFYQFLAANIKVDTNLQRKPLDMSFMYYGGTEDIHTYIEVNEPSIGIVQKKPEFSNISDGLGVFAGRYISIYDDVELRPEMKENLRTSERTAALNFVTE
jgi:hypothetical protein